MARVVVPTHAELESPGGITPFPGDVETSRFVAETVDGDTIIKRGTLGASAASVVFDSSQDFATYTAMLIWAEGDYSVETVIDDDNSVAKKVNSPLVYRGGWPLHLSSQSAYAGDYTESWGAGTLDVIDIVRIKDESAAQNNYAVMIVK